MSNPWLPETDARLRDLWEVENLSSSQCGAAMGLSRNAIIGRVHRLRLKHSNSPPHTCPERPKTERPKTARKRLRRTNHANSRTVVVETAEEMCDLAPDQSEFAVTLADLEPHHCRWPLGEGVASQFCGAPKAYGAYCARHANMAYLTPSRVVSDVEKAKRAVSYYRALRARVAA